MASNHQKIEYEPHKEPDHSTDGYDLYWYEDSGPGIPSDVIVTRTTVDERFRLWGFQNREGIMVHCLTTDHKHPPDFPEADCQKWSAYDDPFPALDEAPEIPQDVTSLVAKLIDAPVMGNPDLDD